jgi:DNA-binding protein H-NS
MALKETVVQVRELLSEMSRDLEKAVKGNKTAAQRVRTASIVFAKTAKVFRKESLAAERGTGRKRLKPSKASSKKKR